MAISRYPRPGQRISPDLLAPVLDVPIPWRLITQAESLNGSLSDLDESTWERLSPNVCAKLGAAVVREISSRIASLPNSILNCKLPFPECWPDYVKEGIEALQLEARTYNCLVAEGLADDLERLEHLTIADLLQIRSFGAKSLVDLLATLESLHEIAEDQAEQADAIEPLDPRVSRYPRPGHRLAPESLREILATPLTTSVKRRLDVDVDELADLDEKLWERHDTQTLAKLGELVVAEVDTHLPSLPPNILYMKLPLPEDPIGLQDLELERRTFNCLQREGLLDQPSRLYQITIKDFLGYRGIGGKSLVDFLTALEHCHPPQLPDVGEAPADGHLEAIETLRRLKTRVGDHFVGRDDPRLGSSLRIVDSAASSLGEIIENNAANKYPETRLRAMHSGLVELEGRLRRCEQLPLRDELASITCVGLNERDSQIVGHYFGWQGHGPQTLKQIGERFGLTRERVRQIGVEQAERVATARPYAPVFLRTIAAIAERVPLRESGLADLLVTQGLDDSKALSLRTMSQAAKLFGIELPFSIAEVGSEAIAVTKEWLRVIDPVQKAARRAVDAWGLGNMNDLIADASRQVGAQLDPEIAICVLECIDGFQWLTADKQWFSLSLNGKNRLRKPLERLFAVGREMHVDTVRGALLRSYKKRELAPPIEAITNWLRRQDGIQVHDDRVMAEPTFTSIQELSSSERTVVELLREHGPELDLKSLEELAGRRGVKRMTLNSRLENSPVITHQPPSSFSLRGQTAPPRVARSTPIVREGLTPGSVIIEAILGADEFASGRLSFNADVPIGTFQLVLDDQTVVGDVMVRSNGLDGLRPLFERRGGQPGDRIELRIEPARGRVRARLTEATDWTVAD